MEQLTECSSCNQEELGSILGAPAILTKGFAWCPSVKPGIYWDGTLNKTRAYTLLNSQL